MSLRSSHASARLRGTYRQLISHTRLIPRIAPSIRSLALRNVAKPDSSYEGRDEQPQPGLAYRALERHDVAGTSIFASDLFSYPANQPIATSGLLTGQRYQRLPNAYLRRFRQGDDGGPASITQEYRQR